MPALPMPPEELNRLLLDWYDRHRRRLPWRAEPGQRADPYHVWLSEIMLQQTIVATVGAYFRRFVELWPTVGDLASADLDAVLHAWQGLGYYARARNLHKCAQAVVERHGGVFPDTEAELLALPGIGAYTAAAIAAIAFDRPATPADGNFERVFARLHAVETPLPQAKPALRSLAAALTPRHRPGDHAQAVMDLGATICTPRSPKCMACPWRDPCEARRLGIAAELPRKSPKKQKPTRRGIAFWAVTKDGSVLLRRRPESGLLGGMTEVPSTGWVEADIALAEAANGAPVTGIWQMLPGLVRHTFTHFHLELTVAAASVPRQKVADGIWVPLDRLGEHALPTVMKKVVSHALAQAGKIP